MKRARGKIIMAAIILSCGFVMQAEQSSEKLNRISAEARSRNASLDASVPAGGIKSLDRRAERNAW